MSIAEEVPSINDQVLHFLREDTGKEIGSRTTLLELCDGNERKAKMLILRLGMAMREELCDLRLVPEIIKKPAAFIAWAMDRNFRQQEDEFAF